MTNPTGMQWEAAVLNKLTIDGKRLAVMELNFVQLNTKIDEPIPLIDFYNFPAVQGNEISKNVRAKCRFSMSEIPIRSIVG
ncbi:MAG: hypothetical protein AAFQ80_24240 [Cyanobacteria bacterium J06621_8]